MGNSSLYLFTGDRVFFSVISHSSLVRSLETNFLDSKAPNLLGKQLKI